MLRFAADLNPYHRTLERDKRTLIINVVATFGYSLFRAFFRPHRPVTSPKLLTFESPCPFGFADRKRDELRAGIRLAGA